MVSGSLVYLSSFFLRKKSAKSVCMYTVPMRPNARALVQQGGPPCYLKEGDPAGCDFVHAACPGRPYPCPGLGLLSCECLVTTPLKKVSDIPFPSRDVTYQTLPVGGNNSIILAQGGLLYVSDIPAGDGNRKPFLQCSFCCCC
jgi:hypothetical protein